MASAAQSEFTSLNDQEERCGCPLCGCADRTYVFKNRSLSIFRCDGCGLTFGRPNAGAGADESAPSRTAALDGATGDADHHRALISALTEMAVTGPLLVVAGQGDQSGALFEQQGLSVGAVFCPEDMEAGSLPSGRFSAAVVQSALMRAEDPLALLRAIRDRLGDEGQLVLSLPLLDGRQAQLMGRHWHEWHVGNRWYFTRETLHLLLLRAGFHHVWFESESRRYQVDYLVDRINATRPPSRISRGIGVAAGLLPRSLRSKRFPLPSGTFVVTAVAAPPPPAEPVLSIILPVYNEKNTFNELMDALLVKQVPGLRKEIILVESNSTDGTRDLVKAYEGHPELTILWQERPRGKGHAVREGLKVATGDIVLIQDADLEYDLGDYDALIDPLLAWQKIFVLGSRHNGSWKMRSFTDAPVVATVFNLGHMFFSGFLNLLLSTSLNDPFTMFKVFRRDAIFGLAFVCNRFDFDHELVIKLVRKGYVPMELPVNYESRSFADGKKVSFVRDGLTWVTTDLRLRFGPLGSRGQ